MIKISSLRSKFLLVLFSSAIFPLVFSVFYTSLTFSDYILNTSEETSEKLRVDAQSHLLRNVQTKAEELNNYFIEVKEDLESFIFTVQMKNDNPDLANEYKGETFAFWAMSQWSKYLDKNKLNRFLNGEDANENFEKLKQYINKEDQLKILVFLKTLLNGFEPLSEENYQESEKYYPRFLIERDVFYDLKSITDKGIENGSSFLFLDFMSEFLNGEGKSALKKGLSMIMPGKAMIDNHETYRNLRLAYWGDGKEGTEFIYTNRDLPLHPAIGSIGNSYFCKSKFAILDNNFDSVWQHAGVLDENEVSVLTLPIFKEFKNKDTDLIGFAEYWIDWKIFSDKLSKYNYYKDEHNFLVNENDIVVSDSKSEHVGENIFEIHDEMKFLKAEINQKESGFSRFIYYGKYYNAFYSFVPEAKLRFFSIVPEASFTVIAEDEKAHAMEHVNSIIVNNLVLAGSMIILISFLSFYFSTSIIKPLKNLGLATRRIGEGDLDVKIEKNSNDEIGELAESFNMMAGGLRESSEQLNKYNKNLEKEVKSRTKELEESRKKLESKLYELEIYSKTTTDRELKMMQLKQEIIDLKNKKISKNA